MPRSTGTVLGLPMPDTPVDIDTPRASRTLKRPTNADGSQDSLSSHAAPPRKVKKTTSSAAQEGKHTGAHLTTSTEPAQSASAPPVLLKLRKTKNSAAPVLGSNAEGDTLVDTTSGATTKSTPDPTLHPTNPTVPTKALKKKKKKNTAPVGNVDSDVEMSVQAPGVATAPGSIIIGDSIVPPSPAKKKQRNKKATPATALDTSDVASGSVSVNTIVGSQSSAAARPGVGSGKGTGRTKTASALAQKVREQETQKKLEKEAKAQRKREKAQQIAITESLEDTAAFVAAGDALKNAPSTNNNIEIRTPEVPVTTGGLQHVNQNRAHKLITQRITQCLLPSALPSSPASTSGSEAPGSALSLHVPSISHSHRASRTPSVSLPLSRSVSVAPSTHSTPAYSGTSRAMSTQPPTRPLSPSSPAFLTLADHLHGIDEEFAPLLPGYNPLPGPLRPPQRLKPVPYKDAARLTAAARREYAKECKFGVKDLTPDDQIIVSSVISRLEVLILTVDCFPTDADTRHLILVANAWGCRKHSLGNLDVEVGGPYEDLLLSRVPQMRSGIIDYTSAKVAEVYQIQTIGLTPEVIQYNKDTMKYWTKDGNFTCPPNDFGALYERSTLEDIVKHVFFQKHNSLGVIHHDLFSTIPIGAIATAAAGLEKSLLEYETGVRVKQNFSRTLYRSKWIGHVATLCTIIKDAHGAHLMKHLRELGQKLLEPFPQPLSSAPAPQSKRADVAKPKLKPKLRLPPTTTLTAAPIAAPPAPKAPIEDSGDTTSESELDVVLEVAQGATADVGNPDAWAESIQAESTLMAQYDALRGILGSESSDGEGDPPSLAHAALEGESSSGAEDESTGEGASGVSELAVEQDGKKHGSDSESDSSDEE